LTEATAHPFTHAPHRTLVTLAFPVLLSLIAEPLTGLVDTAFVSRLGATSLGALGVGTMVLSSVIWIFNFLGIGTQTEVGQSIGGGDRDRTRRVNGLALTLSGLFGLMLLVVGLPATSLLATLMGATGDMHADAVTYIQIRWFGAPAVLITVAAFGTLRGLQDMRVPLWIAVGVNVANIALDAALIFGVGPVPALGVAGAALATVISQWLGAVCAGGLVFARLGRPDRFRFAEAGRLLRVGSDLFVRTGMLTLFLLLAARAATRIGAESAAAHQAIRQFWIFTALFLDAFGITGQSLVAYFMGAGSRNTARRVAGVVCAWSVGVGVALALAMWLGQGVVIRLLVPASAVAVFIPAWLISALSQPINALSFATDGLHWGTGDFRFLRNVMLLSTGVGAAVLFLFGSETLTAVWVVTFGWIILRATFGVLRIWPGIGAHAPLRKPARSSA